MRAKAARRADIKTVSCADIGIRDCSFQTRATHESDLMVEMLEHLREVHRYDIPDEKIGEGDGAVEREPERMILARLRRRIGQA